MRDAVQLLARGAVAARRTGRLRAGGRGADHPLIEALMAIRPPT
jgi:hypothetical protein